MDFSAVVGAEVFFGGLSGIFVSAGLAGAPISPTFSLRLLGYI